MGGRGRIRAAVAGLRTTTPIFDHKDYKLYRLKDYTRDRVLVKMLDVESKDAEKLVFDEIRILKDTRQYYGRGVENRRNCQNKGGPCQTFYILIEDYGRIYQEELEYGRDREYVRKLLEGTDKGSTHNDEAVRAAMTKILTGWAEKAQFDYWEQFRVKMDPKKAKDLNNYQFGLIWDGGPDRNVHFLAQIINFSGGTGPPSNGRRVDHKVFPKESWTQKP